MQFGIAEWDDEDFAVVSGCCVQVYAEPEEHPSGAYCCGEADVVCRVGDNICSFYTGNLEYETGNLYKNVPLERLERMRDHESGCGTPWIQISDFEDATAPWDDMDLERHARNNSTMTAHNYKGP